MNRGPQPTNPLPWLFTSEAYPVPVLDGDDDGLGVDASTWRAVTHRVNTYDAICDRVEAAEADNDRLRVALQGLVDAYEVKRAAYGLGAWRGLDVAADAEWLAALDALGDDNA